MKTTILDVAGTLCLALFAFSAWPPAALLVVGAVCILASWRDSAGGES